MQIQPSVINIFEKAVRKAGKRLLRDFGEIENLQIQSKNLGNFVTNADLKSEQILFETLQYYMGRNTPERQNFIIENLIIEDDIKN